MINDDLYDFVIAIATIIALGVTYLFWPSADLDGPIGLGRALRDTGSMVLLAAAMLAVMFKDRVVEKGRVRS